MVNCGAQNVNAIGREMTELGPYKLDNIYCGECSEMMAALPDECIDLTVTSPPYDNLRDYHSYIFDFDAIAAQLWRVTKLGGVVVWIAGDATIDGSETGTSFRQALGFMKLGFNLHDTMIYQKLVPVPQYKCKRYYSEFEYMFVFSKNAPQVCNYIMIPTISPGRENKDVRLQRNPDNTVKRKKRIKIKHTKIAGNVWVYDAANLATDTISRRHSARFPESLARDHIISWSNPSDIVLDPMIGSGTTAKVAMQTSRHYLGFDISQKYVELARRRVKEAQPPLPGINETLDSTPDF